MISLSQYGHYTLENVAFHKFSKYCKKNQENTRVKSIYIYEYYIKNVFKVTVKSRA